MADMPITHARIAELALAALAGDWRHADSPALVSVMGRAAVTAKDVPAASEMAALLHFLQTSRPVIPGGHMHRCVTGATGASLIWRRASWRTRTSSCC